MSDIISYRDVESKIIEIRGEKVILDSDVAQLYGVQTMHINQAVKNNPDKFPERYIISLNPEEWSNLKSKILISSWGGKNRPPKAFTERGLYMLATILKSPIATQTTIVIIDTFAKMRELSGIMNLLSVTQEEDTKKALSKKFGELFMDAVDNGNLDVIGDETTYELDLALLKVKRTVKRERRKDE